jgi:regulator of RNase E activity RraA
MNVNNFSSTELSDAMDSIELECALLGILPLTKNTRVFGPAFTVKYEACERNQGTTFRNAGEYIDLVPPAHVIVIDNMSRTDCTVWGDILTTFCGLKGIYGVVINGSIRDFETVRNGNFPIFAKGISMRSGKNRVLKTAHQSPVQIGKVIVHPGDFIFGDENGVIAIPPGKVDEIFLRAQNIKVTEEKILAAIKSNSSLKEAREKYKYDQPWLPISL